MSRESLHIADKDLLLWMDREVAGQQASEIQLHLDACSLCRSRATGLEHLMADFVGFYKGALDGSVPPGSEQRARFRALLAERASSRAASRSLLTGIGVAAVAIALLGIAAGTHSRSRDISVGATPNLQLTPGAISPVTLDDVCGSVLSTNDPAVPDLLKREVLQEYGLKDVSNNSYEIDFLVTPQLGGVVNIRNLWPQPALKTVWNARAKDALEDRLHSLVCSGQLDLSTAQHELSRDWVAAYKKYFRTDEPHAVGLLRPDHFAGISRMRCSVASSTAFREYGIG